MSKKSASSVKLVKNEPTKSKKDSREGFQEWKDVNLFTIDASIEQAKRVDTWVNMRDDYMDFMKSNRDEISMQEINAMCSVAVSTLETIKERFEALTFEDVTAEEYEDCLGDMVVHWEDCETLEEMFRAYLVYGLVKQWAPKVFDVIRAIKSNADAE